MYTGLTKKIRQMIFFGLIQSAYAAEFYMTQTETSGVTQGGTGVACPSVTGPSSAVNGAVVWSSSSASSSSIGCVFGILSFDNVLLPLELETLSKLRITNTKP